MRRPRRKVFLSAGMLYCRLNNNRRRVSGAAGAEAIMRRQAMNRKIYHVGPEEDERALLRGTADGGKGSKERRLRAHILLLADRRRAGGGRGDAGTADVLRVGTATVERTRRQCVPGGLEAAPGRRVQLNRKPRLPAGEGEARLTMPACSEPPEGHAQWTLRLLCEKLVELKVVDTISTETVRRTLKKTISSRG